MRVLGIDTSTKTGSIALIQGGSSSGNEIVLAEYTQGHLPFPNPTNGRNDSNSWLLSAIDYVLQEKNPLANGNNYRLKIDGIAVVIGPGTFTGARIGVSAAKGLGYALGIQIAEVISLDALAANIPSGFVCPIIDAMRGEVYAAFYEHGERISEYMLIKPEDLAQRITQPVTLLGDGVMLWEEFFTMSLHGIVSFVPSYSSLSVNTASIGMKMLLEDKGKKPKEVVPFYLRASNAETHCIVHKEHNW
jgi:tRNA threonylcarbamoyladenosine biosynthesis protein TsaB